MHKYVEKIFKINYLFTKIISCAGVFKINFEIILPTLNHKLVSS